VVQVVSPAQVAKLEPLAASRVAAPAKVASKSSPERLLAAWQPVAPPLAAAEPAEPPVGLAVAVAAAVASAMPAQQVQAKAARVGRKPEVAVKAVKAVKAPPRRVRPRSRNRQEFRATS